MPTATFASKGQITLPMAVRTALSLEAGSQVDFVPRVGSFVLVPVRIDVTALKGRFAGRVKKTASIEAVDEAIASGAATRLIEQELTASRQGSISLVVLSDLCRVLSSIYSVTAEELITTVQDLLYTPQFQVEWREAVQAAVAKLKTSRTRKARLVDALISAIAESAGCTETVTFDKGAVRAAGMTLLV